MKAGDPYLRAAFAILRLREQWARLQVEIARDELRNHFALRRTSNQESKP